MSLSSSVQTPGGANLLPIYIGSFCLLWSLAFVAGKIGVTDCPPLIFLSARFIFAGVLILGLSIVRHGGRPISLREIGVFAILGVANNALYLGLGYIGLQTISAGLGALIVSANPVFTAILASMFLGEALTWRKVAGLFLGIVGVALIVAHRIWVGTDSVHGICSPWPRSPRSWPGRFCSSSSPPRAICGSETAFRIYPRELRSLPLR